MGKSNVEHHSHGGEKDRHEGGDVGTVIRIHELHGRQLLTMISKTTTGSQDHRITGSQDHRITGSQDHRITGSQDHNHSHSQDSHWKSRRRRDEDQTNRKLDACLETFEDVGGGRMVSVKLDLAWKVKDPVKAPWNRINTLLSFSFEFFGLSVDRIDLETLLRRLGE